MSRDVPAGITSIDIVCAVLNGGPYIADFIRSVQAQSHQAWRLWLRDDGSTDDTVPILEALARDDSRIEILHTGGPPLGAARAFSWLIGRVPHDATYIMCGDADDVWLPEKMERELAAMQAAERFSPGPVLLHTDLAVVDAQLALIHPSFWQYAHIDPDPVSLRRVVVQNMATTSTIMLNRPLFELIGEVPAEARYQDWWFALVAAAFGRIVAIHEATVLYRQHPTNTVGARPKERITLSNVAREMLGALRRTARVREDLVLSCRQADAFARRYGGALEDEDRRFLHAYSRINTHGLLRRKFEIMRLRLRPEHGLLRNLGVLLRA